MGRVVILLAVAALCLAISYTEAAGSCPLPSKVYSCSPKCKENYECSHGKVCCANSCNSKSCSEPTNGGSAGGDKYSQSGAGVYCNNVKCSPFEVCKQDASSKRMKCQRA